MDEPGTDGWRYDFSDAPRSVSDQIIVILKDRDLAWIRYNFTSPVLAIVMDKDPE